MLWNLGFLVCVGLFRGLSSTANFCKKPSLSPEITANITCDRTLRVFVDGRQIGQESQGFETVSHYVIGQNARSIGLSCHTGVKPSAITGGILGSFSNGVVTNSTWRCSNVAEQGWHEAGFNDSSWPPAVEHAVNAGALSVPWGPLYNITDGAAWIWTANNSVNNSTVYCRFDLQKQETPEPCEERNADVFRSEVSFVDRALRGSVVMTTKAISSIECALRCQRTSQCVSFNFEYGAKINPKICELNSRSARMSPNDVIERKGFKYFDAILY